MKVMACCFTVPRLGGNLMAFADPLCRLADAGYLALLTNASLCHGGTSLARQPNTHLQSAQQATSPDNTACLHQQRRRLTCQSSGVAAPGSR